MRGFIQRADRIAASLSPADWDRATYEQGWTVKQAYCHLASLGASIPFFVHMATNPQPPAGIGAGFDVDAWNAQQVAQRQDKTNQEILTELRKQALRKGAEGIIVKPAAEIGNEYASERRSEFKKSELLVEAIAFRYKKPEQH